MSALDPVWLDEARARGSEVWPALEVALADLEDGVRAHLDARGETEVALSSLDAGELYLACACWRGDTRAILAFRSTYFAPIEPRLVRMGIAEAHCDDLWQELAMRLFVSVADEPPRILTYAGRGQLHGFVKVAATRLALDVLERLQRDTSDTWLERIPGAPSEPALHWIKQRHRAELKQEIEAAIATLAPRDRALLRLTIVERASIASLARTYQTHRSTVWRWILQARAELAAHVRARLAARWQIGDSELSTITMMLDSQIDLSLERVFSAG